MNQLGSGSAEICPSTDALTHVELNAEQLTAVFHELGPALIVAVAGSGKTRVLTHRIAQLVRSGTDPRRILAVTFGKKAAREMNDRLDREGIYDARVGTFHSLALQMVREEWGEDEFAVWRVDDSNRYRNVVKDALGFRYLNWKTADLTLVMSYISWCKASAVWPGTDDAIAMAKRVRGASSCDPYLLAKAYAKAEELRRSAYLLTYDDMLLEAWHLLGDEDVRQRWAARWDHVLQDEAQDENLVQRQIAERLARDHRNYFVVGDPAQSIFGFRGCDPKGLLAFADAWQAKVVRMAANYRSGRRILDVANRAIDLMDPRSHLGVRIDPRRDIDGTVTATRYASFDDEGAGVVKRVLELHADGRAWSEVAVLYRTNAQSRAVEEALLEARVPYFVQGSTNFYDRKEVKDLLAYLRLAAGLGNFDDLRRSINTPFRYLGATFLSAIQEDADRAGEERGWTDIVRDVLAADRRLQQRQKTSAMEWCGIIDSLAAKIEATRAHDAGTTGSDGASSHHDKVAGRPALLLEQLIRDTDYNTWLSRSEGTESPENNRISNVRELVRAAERFPTVDELLDYIYETLTKAAFIRQQGEVSDCVLLSTIHKAKGLEWPCVFVIGANDKILPHALSEDTAEELRLWYVAVTRARDELHVSCVCRAPVGARILNLNPSRFVGGVGLQMTDDGSCRDIALQALQERA